MSGGGVGGDRVRYGGPVDPYVGRFAPPGTIYAPYGWGPGFNVGMPFNYTHHIGYELSPGYDRVGLRGTWSGSQPGYEEEAPSAALAGVLAVL
jgi:hypothetical protein